MLKLDRISRLIHYVFRGIFSSVEVAIVLLKVNIHGGDMGGMNFGPQALADGLSEIAGYKAGLALSIDELCDHLSGTEYPDIIIDSEIHGTRLRSEDYEELFYKLLHRIGYLKEEYHGMIYESAKLFHKYRKIGKLSEFEEASKLFNQLWMKCTQETSRQQSKSIDPSEIIFECRKQFGSVGLEIAMTRIEIIHRASTLDPHSVCRATEWQNPIELQKLFSGCSDSPEVGKFIDQRFLDYLSANTNRLPEIHWRKFEELTAEFFHREGYKVEIGPGSNDDGVDVRAWNPDSSTNDQPLLIAQCKRQKKKVDRVIIKGLHSDVLHEGAEYGVIVTTSELSPAAKNTIHARGYSIQAVERDGVEKWLTALRSPGTGIIR
ncbi:restriction endonuclease [Undibacterium flavidum]|uniref:Restriction endonuclease n=1 Tax=Undibacterium flavidum TaxID=2762297 RepID=A0ABR6YA94_9BURK|nr:restriction endonuclease [Undibacterium flavidum]MBC3873573.1 restriction endonuclease [Undibacterium flavidum]